MLSTICFRLDLKRPTSAGLDTGKSMFTEREIQAMSNDKSVKRFCISVKDGHKNNNQDEDGKQY